MVVKVRAVKQRRMVVKVRVEKQRRMVVKVKRIEKKEGE
jgi:hypothetical protein